MIQIYFASKFKHGNKWKEFIKTYNNNNNMDTIYCCARWVTKYYNNIPDDPQFCKLGWIHDIQDIKKCSILIAYAEAGEILKGSLIEIGAALAFEKPVILVSEATNYGTWKYHPLVHCVETIDDAMILVNLFTSGSVHGEL